MRNITRSKTLKKVNLALLRKQYSDAKRRLEKSQREYEEAVEALEQGENLAILSAVKTHAITPEELIDLLHEFCGDSADHADEKSGNAADDSEIHERKEETPHEGTASV